MAWIEIPVVFRNSDGDKDKLNENLGIDPRETPDIVDELVLETKAVLGFNEYENKTILRLCNGTQKVDMRYSAFKKLFYKAVQLEEWEVLKLDGTIINQKEQK